MAILGLKQMPFEFGVALDNVCDEEVLRLLDYPAYFNLLNISHATSPKSTLVSLEEDRMIARNKSGKWNILNMGAILFANRLSDFEKLRYKAIRVIQYAGKSKIKTIREQDVVKGYACGFENLMSFISGILPANELIGAAFRKTVPMFPELAVRELIVNALIHQDFRITGTAPMIEIFEDRMEITNPGIPLIKIERFLNGSPMSRNEALASFLRRIGMCEERGSGIDKVVSQTEDYQLPAPLFEIMETHTRSTLFAHKKLQDMDKNDRVRATYLHACLKWEMKEYLTNLSLRKRFGIESKNSALVSRIIKEVLDEGVIQCDDASVGNKARKYKPFWV